MARNLKFGGGIMNGYEIYRLVFKVLGVFGVLKALESTQFFVIMFQSTGERDKLFFIQMLSSVLPFILLVLAGSFLWLRSDNFARALSTGIKPHQESKVSVEDIQTVVFTAIGLYILVISVPSLVQVITSNIIITIQELDYIKPTRIPEILKLAIQIALGFWLLLGSRGIVGALTSLRNAGVKEKV